MVNVKIDEETLVNVLMERVDFWSKGDYEVNALYREMYENYVYNGLFDGCELDVAVIVDNDYVNNCGIVSKGDGAYEDLLSLYEEFGLGDISCEHERNNGFNYIEAYKNDTFLVRN